MEYPTGKSIGSDSLWLLLGLFLCCQTAFAQPDSIFSYQEKNRRELTRALIIDGDTVSLYVLDEVLLVNNPTFDTYEAQRRYQLLRRRVIKVYPYAVIAADKLDSLNFALSLISGRKKRKKYIKEFQDYLEDHFTEQLKQLTRSEGQILNKLIYRETGLSTFDLIREHRNWGKAFWYNTLANFYDISLKRGYDPEKIQEDKLIEMILRKAFIEGLLVERVPKTFTSEDFPELSR
ncbi:MAG: DUF4294 domain-containing protein [Flavobacteriales bacterium]|nr:MAG: DUF4294 domain-containing protein [Flavobacteriales bacterium]